MLKELKLFVGILIKSGPYLYGLYKQQKQDDKVVELLESSFLIRDLVSTAE